MPLSLLASSKIAATKPVDPASTRHPPKIRKSATSVRVYRACAAMSSLSVTSSDTIEAHCPAAMPSEAAPSIMSSAFSSKKAALRK